MRRLILALLLVPSPAFAICENSGLYAFAAVNCPQYNPKMDLSIPLCEQPEYKHLSDYDYRCYKEVPFDYSVKCSAWDCPVPYDHVFVEPITGARKVIRGDWYEVDAHYRSARQTLGLLEKSKKGKR